MLAKKFILDDDDNDVSRKGNDEKGNDNNDRVESEEEEEEPIANRSKSLDLPTDPTTTTTTADSGGANDKSYASAVANTAPASPSGRSCTQRKTTAAAAPLSPQTKQFNAKDASGLTTTTKTSSLSPKRYSASTQDAVAKCKERQETCEERGVEREMDAAGSR